MRFKILLFVSILVAQIQVVQAQKWGSQAKIPYSGEGYFDFDIYKNGKMYVAPEADSTVWEIFGNKSNPLNGSNKRALAVFQALDTSSNVFLATRDWNPHKIEIWKHNGVKWSLYSKLIDSAYVLSAIGLEVSPQNELYIAVQRWPSNATTPQESYVYKIKGGTWNQVGTRVDIIRHVQPTFKLSDQGVPYLLYKGVSGRLKLKKYVGTWVDVDSNGLNINVPYITGCDLSLNTRGEPYVSHSDTALIVKHYVNNNWKDISPNLPYDIHYLIADLETRHNVLYMYFMYYIYEYNQTWNRVSDSLNINITTESTSRGLARGIFKIGPHGRPFVAGIDSAFDSINILTAHSAYLNAHKNINYQSITIYPNPANNELYINKEGSEKVQIALYNITGEIVLELNTEAERTKIDISNQKSGVYIIKVKNGESLQSQKIVIQ